MLDDGFAMDACYRGRESINGRTDWRSFLSPTTLAHRLRKAGLDVKQQYPIKVFDEDGTLIGD